MDFYILCEIGLIGLLYARIVRVVWRKSGRYQVISKAQAGAFTFGLIAYLIARVGPLDTLSSRYFSAHIVRSLLLALATPPMLIAGLPGEALQLAVPHGSLGRWSRLFQIYPNMKKTLTFLVKPLPAWGVHAMALCLWLQPGAYQVSLQSDFILSLSQTSLFVAGLVFWISFMQIAGLARTGAPRRLGDALLSAAMLVVLTFLLGGLIAFTPHAQPGSIMVYFFKSSSFGFDDQKLAGMLLWLLAGGVYLAAIWSTVRKTPRCENDHEAEPEYWG